MRRKPVILAAAGVLILIVAVAALWVWKSGGDPYRLPASDWKIFQENFIAEDGRVIDTGNGRVSHSEGQGYGMILAVAFEDRRVFDRLWTWTRENLQVRPDDKLLSWLWKPNENGDGGTVADPNNASDGDLLVAWALIRAGGLWNDYQYKQSAAQILADLARLDVRRTTKGLVLLPGTEGFVKMGGVVVNPSYYVFPAFRDVEKALPGGVWRSLSQAGETLVEEARFGKWNLIPDWLLESETLIPAPGFSPDFGYNAVRVPLHLAWLNPRSELLRPFADFWKTFPSLDRIPSTVNLDDNSFGSDPALPGLQAVAAFTLACVEKRNLTVRDIPVLTKEEPYFSASLKLLTKVAIRESFSHE